MVDRGNCKFFVPNYFNPTKCQNCFKQKDQHASQPDQASNAGNGKQPLSRRASTMGRSFTKTLLKESYLLKGIPSAEQVKPSKWAKFWYVLHSTGELQEYNIKENGQVNKDVVNSSILLQDYIRMLDGKVEIQEDLCFGVKALRDTVYYKTLSRVDYENWWKEFSSFIAAPLKRTTSTASSIKSNSNYSRPNYLRQYTLPTSGYGKSLSRSSRSSSISSLHSESDQMDSLKSQVTKLEDENKKLSKTESERRKLELEVNYWKEYVTNSQTLKRTGSVSKETGEELSEARQKLIQMQDELNQSQKKLKANTTKLLMQNKELNDSKQKLQEANSITAVYKAKIDLLTKELAQRDQLKSNIELTADEILISSGPGPPPQISRMDHTAPSSETSSSGKEAQNLEDKFLLLKELLKRKDRELFLKSKELEKANESRSKVAKYTRSLLQELEARLGDSQQKLTDTDDKLKTANTELAMERERRIKLEEGPRRRMSSIITPQKLPSIDQNEGYASAPTTPVTPNTPTSMDLTEHDADTKYADYYRSRYKEAESSLLQKDKKLHQVEEKLKQAQLAMKNNTDTFQAISDLQTKLSDATHKLSDRQLKIHELQREIDTLRGFEKSYVGKLKQSETLEEMVKDYEKKDKQQTKSFNQAKQELELLRIREIVLKEKLQLFIDDSETSEDDDDATKILKALEVKQKIENYVETEALVKKLTSDKEKLTYRNDDLEARLKKINIQNFKTRETNSNSEKDIETVEKEELTQKLKDLETLVGIKDEKFYSELTYTKEKHKNEMSTLQKKHNTESEKLNGEISLLNENKQNIELQFNNLTEEINGLNKNIEDLNEQLESEKSSNFDTQTLLSEKENLLQEIEERCKRITIERDTLKESEQNKRNSFTLGSSEEKKTIEGGEQIDKLSTENHEFKMKNRQLERQLRMSLERMEDLLETVKDKGVTLEGWEKDRDSGIVLQPFMEGSLPRQDSEDVFETPRGSVSSEPDSIEKYKNLCNTYRSQLKDITEKYIASETESIKMATELENRIAVEQDYESVENKISDVQSQIMEFHDSLTNKSTKLEAERENVMNLVEVTSNYIRKLEGSLSESKLKIQELQSLVPASSTESERQPPEGASESTGLSRNSSITRQSSFDVTDSEDVNLVRQKLTAKIMILQSDISELKTSYTNEIETLKQESQTQIERLRNRLSEDTINEGAEELMEKIEILEKELEEQKNNYSKDIQILQSHFQEELKAAFSGDTGGIDMLNRVQELEIEIELTRKDGENRVKEMQDEFEKEKLQLKDDMAMVLQASLSATFSDDMARSNDTDNASAEELNERIIALEDELEEIKEKYEEELEMEKEAHKQEMEDTIRDMMFVRDATNRGNNFADSPTDDIDKTDGAMVTKEASVENLRSASPKVTSSNDIEAIRTEYELKLQQQLDDHDEELSQVRSDMAIVITSLKHGESSEMIMELQSKIKDLEQEIDELKLDFAEERKEWESKLQQADNINFFGLRRQDELGARIYNMQNEMEEVERKHEMEIEAYQERLGMGGNDDNNVTSTMKINEELKEKVRDYEQQLEKIDQSRSDEMIALTMRLQEENQKIVEELTDKVLKLESLIDSMEIKHQVELKEYENSNEEEHSKTNLNLKNRIAELELICKNMKVEFDEEVEELISEHKREVINLRSFYEKEIGEIKKRSGSESSTGGEPMQRRTSVAENTQNKIKILKEKHTKEIETLKEEFSTEQEALISKQAQEINDIRTQYDEKLKFSYKEGLRRQSVSERKSDATRMRELITEKEAATTKLLELEIKHENDTSNFSKKISYLQRIINEFKNHKCEQYAEQTLSLAETKAILQDDSEAKLKEMQDQIDRWERRIDYYREKSQRENCEESHRVAELQSDIVELHKEMNNIRENRRRQVYEKEKRERDPMRKMNIRRNTDGAVPPRRHTDDTVSASSRVRDRDPRKRWSNLEERTEVITRNIAELEGKRNPRYQTAVKKEEGKSGTVLARKTLWENISIDDQGVATTVPTTAAPLVSPKTPTAKVAPQVK